MGTPKQIFVLASPRNQAIYGSFANLKHLSCLKSSLCGDNLFPEDEKIDFGYVKRSTYICSVKLFLAFKIHFFRFKNENVINKFYFNLFC